MSSTVFCALKISKSLIVIILEGKTEKKHTSKQIDFVTITLYDNKVYEGNNAP